MMMNRRIIQTSVFAKKLAALVKSHKIQVEDFEEFKRKIAEHPETGDIIQGTGGLRKIRLKSSSGGKRGGFRVCYYFHDIDLGEIFLITIYAKNEKEDITPEEKKDLKSLVNVIKRK